MWGCKGVRKFAILSVLIFVLFRHDHLIPYWSFDFVLNVCLFDLIV